MFINALNTSGVLTTADQFGVILNLYLCTLKKITNSSVMGDQEINPDPRSEFIPHHYHPEPPQLFFYGFK